MVTNAKQELAKQIKSAIRSQRRSAKIYDVVKHHSFIDIPLFPIEDPKESENEEINTMYNVTVSQMNFYTLRATYIMQVYIIFVSATLGSYSIYLFIHLSYFLLSVFKQ